MYLRGNSYSGYGVCRVRADTVLGLNGGGRKLYRTLELLSANPLKDAHTALDTAVLASYGFHPGKDLLAKLLALNQSVAGNIKHSAQVAAPGLPADAAEYITADCIQPK